MTQPIPNAAHARHMSADALDRIAAVTAPETITISREALVDLLTTAAVIGREAQGSLTRGDITDRLRMYGLAGLDMDRAIANAERNVAGA